MADAAIGRRSGTAKIARIAELRGQRGLYFVARRAWCRLIYPYRLYAMFGGGRRFTLDGRSYPYFHHRYNTAWRNERTAEIAVFAPLFEQYRGKRILEVGNVLSHYVPAAVPGESHIVLDKYELADGVVNADVVGYDAEPFDLIISISTLEHVGWDETPRDPDKVLRAIGDLTKLVKPGGKLVVSTPMAYNPRLDRALADGELPFDRVRYLKRTSQSNRWREVGAEAVADVAYDDPYPGASAITVCTWGPRLAV